ncbi:MAG: hypothetical protein ACJA1U_000663 [Bermanella sp.]|jgi:hypothetical protein
MKLYVLLCASIMLLAGCGSGSESGSESTSESGSGSGDIQNNEPLLDPVEEFLPTKENISSMTLVDAVGQPLKNAQVEILSQVPVVSISPSQNAFTSHQQTSLQGVLTTDESGNLVLNDLAPGTYTLKVTVSSVMVTSIVVINEGNASGATTIATPLVVEGENVTSLQNEDGENEAIFASISGAIYDKNGPISQVQIEISGGAETNGALAVDVTNDNGEYLLILNVSLSKLQSMQTASIRIVKTGYVDFTASFDPTSALAFIGQNFELTPLLSNSDVIVYEDDFEQLVDGAVCGGWIAQAVEPSDLNFDSEINPESAPLMSTTNLVVEEPQMLHSLWHSHESDLDIVNAAMGAGHVLLAPDDMSGGLIPEPLDQKACWYGQAEGGNVGQGNFLGGATDVGDPLNGGTSDIQNGGAIVSPVIDLTQETAPLALTFKTWWEIESVNPNGAGFDLLIVEYSTDGGDTWNDLARLNPLSDPQTGCIQRDPLPFSNRGFNRAPMWLAQEPIDVSVLAGEGNSKIRFVFRTQDELFNGFRGWLLDNVSIVRQAGTFPLFDPINFDDEVEGIECDTEGPDCPIGDCEQPPQ